MQHAIDIRRWERGGRGELTAGIQARERSETSIPLEESYTPLLVRRPSVARESSPAPASLSRVREEES